MGLKLRYNLFFDLKPEHISLAREQFWREEGNQLVEREFQRTNDRQSLADKGGSLYQPDGPWTLFSWPGGWEWVVRRQAQFYISRVFKRPGLLVFVYDGSYWGYELFHNGQAIDHFVQDAEQGEWWFPDQDCRGNPALFGAQFPSLRLDEAKLASYLIQIPPWLTEEEYEQAEAEGEEIIEEKVRACEGQRARLNVLANDGDEFTRFSQCAVLDFLRFLGLHIELRDHVVTPLAPRWGDL